MTPWLLLCLGFLGIGLVMLGSWIYGVTELGWLGLWLWALGAATWIGVGIRLLTYQP